MNNHDIIVIGGSTGSLEALERLFADLPGDLLASLFIVTHVAPGHDDLLPSILNGIGPLAARTQSMATRSSAASSTWRLPGGT